MVAAARIPQCVKIVALFDVKFVRHEHVVDPAIPAPRHVGDIHCRRARELPSMRAVARSSRISIGPRRPTPDRYRCVRWSPSRPATN